MYLSPCKLPPYLENALLMNVELLGSHPWGTKMVEGSCSLAPGARPVLSLQWTEYVEKYCNRPIVSQRVLTKLWCRGVR